jgi:hypothetical protein
VAAARTRVVLRPFTGVRRCDAEISALRTFRGHGRARVIVVVHVHSFSTYIPAAAAPVSRVPDEQRPARAVRIRMTRLGQPRARIACRYSPSSTPVRYGPRAPVRTKLDPYNKPIIEARLAAYPELSAVRLLDEIRSAGYARGYTQLKAFVHRRPSGATPQPVIRFETTYRARTSVRVQGTKDQLTGSRSACVSIRFNGGARCSCVRPSVMNHRTRRLATGHRGVHER